MLPFLIGWGRTPHPAAGLPVVPLAALEAVHPGPGAVRGPLAALGAADLITVRAGRPAALTARLDAPSGPVVLGPPPAG
ncbi:hypothetical protein [Actinomadura parmotrematis]|uniref:Uncharacterized protein n=1 Tax=Actinomadura parmotrematis TaxID=2864039 RepID=A0ABS7FZS4_9ACTN|nr:hypothetical protein [Actinomadura parmotrematis]MBW8485943.1 hypothetical protein [Actinomadura parmotrematis]